MTIQTGTSGFDLLNSQYSDKTISGSINSDYEATYGLLGSDILSGPWFGPAALAGGYGSDTYDVSGWLFDLVGFSTIYDSEGSWDNIEYNPQKGYLYYTTFVEIDGSHLMATDSDGRGFIVVDWEKETSQIENWSIFDEDYSYDEWHKFVETRSSYQELSAEEVFGSAVAADEWRDSLDALRNKDAELQGLIQGSDVSETLEGTSNDEAILGDSGNDFIYGREGIDHVEGGAGDDYVQGNQGNDKVYGGEGNDTVRGGKDDDWVYGDEGDDLVMGDKGVDVVQSGSGQDFIRGGQENDKLYAGSGDDTLMGDLGNDTLNGWEGADLFLFRNGDGSDLIEDFDGSEGDRIQLRDTSDFSVSTSNGNTVITYDGDDQITLDGVSNFDNDWVV